MLFKLYQQQTAELDVNHVRQIRMDMFLPYLLEKSSKEIQNHKEE